MVVQVGRRRFSGVDVIACPTLGHLTLSNILKVIVVQVSLHFFSLEGLKDIHQGITLGLSQLRVPETNQEYIATLVPIVACQLGYVIHKTFII